VSLIYYLLCLVVGLLDKCDSLATPEVALRLIAVSEASTGARQATRSIEYHQRRTSRSSTAQHGHSCADNSEQFSHILLSNLQPFLELAVSQNFIRSNL